jgi:calcium-dependent protein kinase
LLCGYALQEILKHDWLVKEGVASDTVLDSVVLKRMRQFAQMNKLKKMCLMVVGQHLSPDEIAGGCLDMHHACS